MHPSLAHLEHRPWPLPAGRWRWRQSWRDLLFAHWALPVSAVRAMVPRELEIDSWRGHTWVGVVPFRMTGVMRRPWPALPWVSAFPELNVRLYVSHKGMPGVWFLSLDATNPLAIWAARRFFHLPYYQARMSLSHRDEAIHYTSERANACFEGLYEPSNEVFHARPGSLEHWLTERYCLYARSPDGQIWRNQVHHEPWPLQPARADISRNTMLASHGLTVSGPPVSLLFARRIDVVVWASEPVR